MFDYVKKFLRENHMLAMALACIIPLVLIFALPFFGVKLENSNLLIVGLMVVAHVLVMLPMHASEHSKEDDKNAKCH